MAQYRTYKSLNLPEIDREIAAFWNEKEIFKKSIENRSEENSFVFYEGPPSANGMPGIHHVMARTVKDLFCRFHTMKGKRVERKGGWDTHGLPVELKVEKELGITKEDIGTKISVDDYNKACRETVMRYKDLWDDITRKMGYWVDLDYPYITFDNEYIESVWYLLGQMYNKDLMYKGYTVQPYSPAAGTGLSSHELNLPGCYKNVKDTSAVAQFKLIKNAESAALYDAVSDGDVYFIAWTTTPWTLPSNTALAVGHKIEYQLVATYNPYTKERVNVVLAKELMSKWFKSEAAELDFDAFKPEDKLIPFRVEATFTGKDFDGIRYEQLLQYAQPEDGDAFRVLLGDFVSTEDGTGIVHLAPSFGADDMRVAKQNGIGSLTLVDKQGKFVDEVTDFAGRYVKDYKEEENYRAVDVQISIKLKEENKAFKVEKYEHSYPHCWRTDKPVLYYPLDSWFVKASAQKERMAELNKTINWKPESTGTGRFGAWLDNLLDWNLSRSRYWGIPLPIWRNEDATSEICITSIEMLGNEIEKANKALGLSQEVPKDLHRPYIDDVTLVDDSGKPMTRELDLIDVWFDSGSMPYAQWHYPFENKEKFENNFPADFIAEGVDQTRGWFYTLHAISTMIFDQVAYKNVVSNGLVLDSNGVKMSKSKGNVIDPFETIEKHGADATRWYMMSNSNPWDNLKFDMSGIEEVKRKFFGTLYNTYSFFALYANIDGFSYAEKTLENDDLQEIDKWVISLLNSLVEDVEAAYADYEPTKASRMIQTFVEDHLSNWYVRLCRRRFWKGEYTTNKIAAYQTLYTCLETVTKLMAPVAPFFSDWMFQNLNSVTGRDNHLSVHLANFPEADHTKIDAKLEQRMDYAQRISSLVLSLRKKDRLRVRQPLERILLPILDEDFEMQVEQVKDLILAEVNIKRLEYVHDASGVIKKKIKPNFKTLGRKLGKDMKAAVGIITAMDQDDIARIEKAGVYNLVIEDRTHNLTIEDFEVVSEDIPGWQVAVDRNLTVALDTTLSDELIQEGFARELVNRIQNIRKNNDFDVTDRIHVKISKDDRLDAVIENFGNYIQDETLADSINLVDGMSSEIIDLQEDFSVQIEAERV